MVQERENNRKRDRDGKERLSERQKERDRVWCNREKIIEKRYRGVKEK